MTGATAGWTVREPEQYSKDGAMSTGLVEVLSNTLYFDPNWTKTRAEKVPFVGILALKMRSDVVSECFYRVLRSAETLDRETIRRAEYELGTESLDPPPWAQRSGVIGSCDYSQFSKPGDADGAMDVDDRVDVAKQLAIGDHPPLVSGLDFSQLFNESRSERRGMAALQPGDRVYLALHQTGSWPKGITSDSAEAVEATHAVLREAAQPSEGPPASSLKVPGVLQAVPAPAERAAVQQLSTAQHGSVVTPIFDFPEKGGQIWVDAFVAFLFFPARQLQTGLQSKTLLGFAGLQGAGKTLLLKYLENVLIGPNGARYVKNLARLMLQEFFQVKRRRASFYHHFS